MAELLPVDGLTSEIAQQFSVFNAALSATEDFLYVFDLKGRFLYANRALCELLKLSLSEVVGRTFFDLGYPQALAETLHRQIDDVITTKSKIRAETPFTNPEGHTGIYEYIFCPIFSDTGEVESVTGVTRDITESFQTRANLAKANVELAAKASQAEESYVTLQRLFHQAPGFFAVLSGKDHVIEIVNAAYTNLVGERPLLGMPVRDAIPESVDQGFVTILDKVLATGEPFLGRAIPFVASRAAHEAPTEAYLDFVYQPIFDDAGNASGVFVQGHEVTEQYVARQALVDADRQKDRFIATLAHELRNPLGPVRNAAALLRMPELSTERIERATGIISRQVGHMARLLDDLLDVARLRNGQLILKIEDINPDDVIQLAIEAASPAIEEKQHSFSHEKFGPDVVLRVDPARLAQVITNLLTNSAKYTRARGQLRLTSFTRDGEWIVSVSDNGVGLGAEALDRVFDMFAQEQSASDLPQTGLGIGLAISKSLIELHGGMLIAESDGINRGSTFTVRIPPESVRILMTS